MQITKFFVLEKQTNSGDDGILISEGFGLGETAFVKLNLAKGKASLVC